MYLIIFQFAISAFIIIIAGAFLTKFSDKIAELTGWGRMFVGGLLLAGATSLPEFMVDIHAVKNNLPDLAVGDLFGSSLFNLLILSILDMFYPSSVRGTIFTAKYRHHATSAVLAIILTSIVGVAIVSKIEASFFGVNIFAISSLIVYFYGLRLIFIEGSSFQEKVNSSASHTINKSGLIVAFSGYIVSALVILFAAPYLVDSADKIALSTGVGHSFIGTTLVAFTTSLPELVATLVAVRMGAPDMALGNILGSSAFNMILFAPLDFLYNGSLFKDVSTIHTVTAFSVITTIGFAVLGFLRKNQTKKTYNIELGSGVIVFSILLHLLLLYFTKGTA